MAPSFLGDGHRCPWSSMSHCSLAVALRDSQPCEAAWSAAGTNITAHPKVLGDQAQPPPGPLGEEARSCRADAVESGCWCLWALRSCTGIVLTTVHHAAGFGALSTLALGSPLLLTLAASTSQPSRPQQCLHSFFPSLHGASQGVPP